MPAVERRAAQRLFRKNAAAFKDNNADKTDFEGKLILLFCVDIIFARNVRNTMSTAQLTQ